MNDARTDRKIPMEKLSIVVPCYNEEESLPIFYDSLKEVSSELSSLESGPQNIELILVDDGSSDGTLETFKLLSNKREAPFSIHWISFSRNFGKESALFAGLEAASGDWICTMDADMQDPPSLLPTMWNEISDGEYDCISTRRDDRTGEPPVRSAFARLFYRIINCLSDAEIVDGARDFRLMSRQMADAVLMLKERNRFIKGIYGWVGFKTKWISYDNVERAAGTTKWNFWKLSRYAIDGIVAFSTAPLAIASILGIIACIIALMYAAFIFIRALIFGDPVAGWPTMMVIILLLGGAQLLCIGVVGRYLANTYIESKQRPIYIVRETGGSVSD